MDSQAISPSSPSPGPPLPSPPLKSFVDNLGSFSLGSAIISSNPSVHGQAQRELNKNKLSTSKYPKPITPLVNDLNFPPLPLSDVRLVVGIIIMLQAKEKTSGITSITIELAMNANFDCLNTSPSAGLSHSMNFAQLASSSSCKAVVHPYGNKQGS